MSSLPGRIVAIDRDAGMLTIDPWYYYGASSSPRAGPRVFAYRDGAIVLIGNERRDFRDLRIGDWVTVVFHQERNGQIVANGVAMGSPYAMSCTEKQS